MHLHTRRATHQMISQHPDNMHWTHLQLHTPDATLVDSHPLVSPLAGSRTTPECYMTLQTKTGSYMAILSPNPRLIGFTSFWSSPIIPVSVCIQRTTCYCSRAPIGPLLNS